MVNAGENNRKKELTTVVDIRCFALDAKVAKVGVAVEAVHREDVRRLQLDDELAELSRNHVVLGVLKKKSVLINQSSAV